MIQHPCFPIEDWNIRETELHLDALAQTESIFALANGHLGLRGNLDEGEPFGLPGTYLNAFDEQRLLSGSPLTICHHGDELSLPSPEQSPGPFHSSWPTQPPGRAPIARSAS